MYQAALPKKPLALIAGVVRELGQEVAHLLGRDSGMTVLIGTRDVATGLEVTDNLTARGIDARFVRLDVTDSGSIAAATRWIGSMFDGRLDVLVNSACVTLDRFLPNAQGAVTFKDAFDANVRGPLVTSKAVLPFLRQSPAGRIVNVTSRMGLLTSRNDPDWELAPYKVLCYNCSKAALRMQTILFASEVERAGSSVKINAIDCGGTAADLVNGAAEHAVEQSARAVVRLATLPPHGPSGGVFSEDQPLP